ncbi:MAG: sugar kinase [Armatimonadetes bacterium]|nr:sugar kinase [Armatimonadota bacterium]
MPEVVAVGEALVEIMRRGAGVPLEVVGEFVGPYASGAPAIFADQVARLGHRVAFVGAVGQDAFGRIIIDRLEADGVMTTELVAMPHLSTGVAFITYRKDGSREFIFHMGNAASGALPTVPEMYLARAQWLHICGSTLAASSRMRDVCYKAVEDAHRLGCDVSFDPNLRPELLMGGLEEFRALCEPVLARAALVLPGATELAALTGEDDPQAGAEKLLDRGARIVAVKLGPDGCLLCTPEQSLRLPPYPVEVVDPTGAGDCFAAGVVCGLLEGLPLEEIGRLANACGALAATEQGPMEGAKFRADVEAFIRQQEARQ